MGYRRLLYWGILCGTAAVGASLLVRIFFGGSYPPELAAQTLFSLVPGFLESRAVESLGPLAKYSAFAGASIANIFVLALVPVAVQRMGLMPADGGRRALLFSALSFGVLSGLTAIFVSVAQISSNPVSEISLLASLLVPSLIFGLSMGSVRPLARSQPPPAYPVERPKKGFSRKRRLFIKGAVGTAAGAVILYYGLSLLASRPQPSPNTNEAAQLLAAQVTPNSEFYRVDVNVFAPTVDSSTWKLKLHGLVNTPMTLDYSQILTLPAVEEHATLECVSNKIGGDLMSTALWKGTKLGDLLNSAGISLEADHVVFRCYDGYDVGIPLDAATKEGTILAYEMNGEKLPVEHGFPLRAIVPGLYGMMNAKWVTEIEVVQGVYSGFWQRKGWENDAHYQTGSTILTPGDSVLRDRFPIPTSITSLPLGLVSVAGVAFAGDRGIKKVEVTTDGGGTWVAASLQNPLSNDTWVLWRYDWNPRSPGTYKLMVRATDGTGAVQTATMTDPFPNGATGYQVVEITVSGS